MASRTTLAAGVTAALLLAGCSSNAQSDTGSSATPGGAGARVVATTTIWGNIAGQIVDCAGVGEVTTLMPVGADPHDYSPSSQDMAAMVAADLVIVNGLGLEEGLEQSIESAKSDGATVFEVAPQVDPLPFGQQAPDSQAHASQDPHVWQDVTRTAKAAGLIGAALTRASGNPDFAECGTLLQGELMTVNDEVAATLAKVPEDRRILVTDHDALGYLAAAYGYTVAGTVVPGGSTLAEPSSAELAALAATVKEAGVPAIFANTANPQALSEALAEEVGDVAVVDLYVDSVGEPGSGADTYQGMVRTNAQRISEALGG